VKVSTPSTRRVLVAVIVAGLVLSAAGAANAVGRSERRTTITYDCHHVDVRPRWIVFACGDGGFFVRRLEWTRWHPFRAVATGMFHLNDCDPTCAGGEIHQEHGKLRTRGRRWCPEIERYVFERAVVRFAEPLVGFEQQRFRMHCSI
jgi:hypothetical protein